MLEEASYGSYLTSPQRPLAPVSGIGAVLLALQRYDPLTKPERGRLLLPDYRTTH
jgi:hypothetical protein